MSILVTGGTGFVGSHLVEALLARGRTGIRCLMRDVQQPRWLAPLPIERVAGTLEDPAALERAAEGVDVIYHVAGLTKAGSREAFLAGNADGAVRMAEAALKSAPRLRRFVLVSSLAASGPARDGRPIREDDPCQPVSSYGESKLAAETRLRAMADRLPLTVIRPPLVFGARDLDFFVFFQAVARHLRPTLGWGKTLSWVYAPDLADGMIAAAEADRPSGATYFLAAPEGIRAEDLGRAVARAVGTWSVPVRIPDAITAMLAWGADAGNRLMGRQGIFNPEKAREIAQKAWVCDVARARADLGVACETPLDRALGETAEWYRKQGML